MTFMLISYQKYENSARDFCEFRQFCNFTGFNLWKSAEAIDFLRIVCYNGRLGFWQY